MPYFRDKWAQARERLLIAGTTATFIGWASVRLDFEQVAALPWQLFLNSQLRPILGFPK